MHDTFSDARAHAYLHEHGIAVGLEELDAMVGRAVDSLQRTLRQDDPREELTPAEIETLKRGGFVVEPRDLGENDPLARTAALYAAILETSLTAAQAAERLGVASSRIRQRLTSKPPSLYGIRTEKGWLLPVFQFDGDALVRGFDRVAARLDPGLHPVGVYRWFTLPNVDLPADVSEEASLSPREWLRRGYPIADVTDLADQL